MMAAAEVQEQERYLASLTSAHREECSEWDWEGILAAAPPTSPRRLDTREKEALAQLAAYRPSLWDRLFGRVERRAAALREAVAEARRLDDLSHREKTGQHMRDLQEWETLHKLASQVCAGETAAWLDVIREFQHDICEDVRGKSLEAELYASGRIVLTFHAYRMEDIIPHERKTLLKTGKLSEKPFPKGDQNKIYADYVCATAFRLAKEVLALVPTPHVLVHVKTDLLNEATGHLEESVILSVAVPRETVPRIQWADVDPVRCLDNFNHRSGLKKTKPPERVDPLSG